MSFSIGVQNEKEARIKCVVLLMILPLLSAGGGAYGGYKVKEEGYTIQNPITKEKNQDKEKK
jgi:hypothetical protein